MLDWLKAEEHLAACEKEYSGVEPAGYFSARLCHYPFAQQTK